MLHKRQIKIHSEYSEYETILSHLTGLGHVSYNKAADQRANTTDKPALAIAIITMSEKSSGRLF